MIPGATTIMPRVTLPPLIAATTPPPAATSTSRNVPQVSAKTRRHSREESKKSSANCRWTIRCCCAGSGRSRPIDSMPTSRSMLLPRSTPEPLPEWKNAQTFPCWNLPPPDSRGGIGRGSRIHPIDLYTIEPGTEMGRQVAIVLYVVAMAAVIVGVDFVFFRNRFWERLTVNIGIVLVFAAFYLRFLRRP